MFSSLPFAAGLRVVEAHLVSCAVGLVSSVPPESGGAAVIRQHVHLLIVSAIAVFLRGAVLGLLTNVWGWPAQVAIVLAILATLAVAIPGFRYSLATTTWTIGSGDRWRVAVIGLVAISFLLRLFYIGQVELLPEDSYYWNYSQHLDLGYLDHPPMVAWLIWLGTHVFGGSEFGVRIGALCCAGVAAFFSYRLTRNLFGEDSALVALVLLQVMPFFFLAGLLMTPDAPLTAAWSAALYFLERALLGGQARAWLFAGIAIGLGLISKYTIGMLVPVAFAVCAPRSAFTPVVVPLAAVCGVGDCRPDFLPGDPLERAARMGVLCLPDIPATRREAEVLSAPAAAFRPWCS